MATQDAAKYSATDVAKYFLTLQEDEAGDAISNLRLQKLLYYAQGYHLAIFDEPLFRESIKRWAHGPVVPEVYHDYKERGGTPIPVPEDVDFTQFDAETREFLDEVYSVFGQFSAWKLRQMTHDETPWREANDNGPVSLPSLKRFFTAVLEQNSADNS